MKPRPLPSATVLSCRLSLQSPPLAVELGKRGLRAALLALPPLDAIGEVLQLRRGAFLDGQRGFDRACGSLELPSSHPDSTTYWIMLRSTKACVVPRLSAAAAGRASQRAWQASTAASHNYLTDVFRRPAAILRC
jgi:hypothetical protein